MDTDLVPSEAIPQRRRLSSGLSSSSSLPSRGHTPSSGLASELQYHDKQRCFREYMRFLNVTTVQSSGQEDYDLRYDQHALNRQLDQRYVVQGFSRDVRHPEMYACPDVVADAFERYDVRKRQCLITQSSDFATQSGKKYADRLQILRVDNDYHECGQLGNRRLFPFKNNLAESWRHYKFIASGSTLLVMNEDKLIRTVETQPRFTLREHIVAAVMFETPHTINFIKVSRLNNKDVLLVCVDDGRALVYEIGTDGFLELIARIKLKFTVWGADSKGDFLVLSDNSRCLTLLYIKENCVYFNTTKPLGHNVPSVEIVHVHDDTVLVSCVSISGELVMFEFKLDEQYTMVKDIPFRSPLKFDTTKDSSQSQYLIYYIVSSCVVMTDDGWTVTAVNSSHFKEVSCPEYLGSGEFDSRFMLEKSRILNMGENHMASSAFGGAARFENLLVFTKYGNTTERPTDSDSLISFSDNFNKIKKRFFRASDEEPEHSSCIDDVFLFVTTGTHTGLYRADGLICNAHTSEMFIDVEMSEEGYHFCRMSICKLIPGLSAIIAVSQSGFATVFRLVKHRGVHCMREEYTIKLATEEGSEREEGNFDPIAGCCVSKISQNEEVYMLELIHCSGSTKKFILRESNEMMDLLSDIV